MKVLVTAAVVAALATLGAQARAQTPDFGGTWLMDMSRSASAAQAEPIAPVTLVISITGPVLTVERRQDGDSRTIRYTIGGGETVTSIGTDEARGRAQWDGADLVTVTSYDIQDVPLAQTEVRSLSPDGREMTVATQLVVEHGYESSVTPNAVVHDPRHAKGEDVYVRQ